MRHSAFRRNLHGQITACLISVFVLVATAYGQSEEAQHGSEEALDILKAPAKLPYRLTGRDVPRYYLVKMFLSRAISYYQEGDDFYEQFLGEIGLEEGTNAEASLVRAIERTQVLFYGIEGPIVEQRGTSVLKYGRPNRDDDLEKIGEDAWRERARAHHKQQARSIADIFHALLTELSDQGVSTESLENYLHNRIAPSTSVSSDEPWDKPRPSVQEFEEQLRKRGKEVQQPLN